MFGQVAWFELRYQLKNPVLWVTFSAFFLAGFIVMADETLQIGAAGNAYKNGPFALTLLTGNMAILAQFAVVAFVSNAVIRDWDTGFGSILYTTRIRKFDYLIGRFVGAFAASVIVLLASPLGMMIGAAMPWLDSERFGPFVLWHYIHAFMVAGLPTLFLCAALFFSLATATRSMMGSYLGLVAFLIFYVVLNGILGRPQYRELSALLEPYGIGALMQETRYWTASDRNVQLIPLSQTYLANRALWSALALSALLTAYLTFSFSRGVGRADKKLRLGAQREAPGSAQWQVTPAKKEFGSGAAFTQMLARIRFEAVHVFFSPAFIVLMGFGLFNAGGSLWLADEGPGHSTVFPITSLMAKTLIDSFTFIPIIIATYYSGELAWRDREKRIHEIMDSTPAANWTFVIPKVAALLLVLAASIAVSVVAGIVVQTLKGFHDYNVPGYLLWYALPAFFTSFCSVALAVLLQAISPNKFVGWAMMIVYLLAILVSGQMGFDHHLYLYGHYPSVPISEMNGQGHYWIGAAWFQLYWALGALLLITLACALWRRGADPRVWPRLRALPQRLAGVTRAITALLVLGFVSCGAWIFYNTNILNTYRSSVAMQRWQADMERTLLRYEHAPMPKISDVSLTVDLYPHQHRAITVGTYQMENRTSEPLHEIYLFWPQRAIIDRAEIDGGVLERDFARETPAFPFQIWRLSRPMQPGERRRIQFVTRLEYPGFRNNDVLTPINDNGTFVNDRDLTPLIGFDRSGLLRDRNIRRRQGLPADLRIPRLEDEDAQAVNYLRHDSDWVNADITVSTVADQTPIAPGYVVSDTTSSGRRTVRYRSDAPILQFFSIQSAVYATARERWGNVDLTIYYDHRHTYNIERMLRAMRASLELCSRKFSAFQFHQLRIIEFPAYWPGAQSFANTVPFAESLGFTTRFNDVEGAREADRIDITTYATAHEISHQWWGHQVIGSDQQGATMLSETFAQYSALLVMEEIYGRDQVRRFLRFELDTYLRGRNAEVVEELPLARVENQPYIHYNKGGVVMYFLRNELGEEVVNRSLARLLREFAFRGAPYPRSTDFLRILREEAGPEHDALVTDLFERITLYDARVLEASAVRSEEGRWDVTMLVEAHKRYADGKGAEAEAPLDEAFEIGVFAAEPGEGRFTSNDVIMMARQRIRSGLQKITLRVDRAPRFAGIDPYNMRIDRNSGDNVCAVQVKVGDAISKQGAFFTGISRRQRTAAR